MMKLRDVAKVKGGKRLPKGANFSEVATKFPYIRVVDFRDGSIVISGLKYLTEEVQKRIRQYTISKEDVYISIAGTIGLVGTIPEWLSGANLTENAAKLVLTEPSSLDKNFLALYLSSEAGQSEIDNLTTKTTQPKLALNRIEQILLPHIPIEEQLAIVSVVETILRARDTRSRELYLERERRDALMEWLFTYGTRGEPTKQTKIGEIPESWQILSMAVTVEIKSGQVDPRNEPYSSMKHVGPDSIEPKTGRLLSTKTAKELKLISGKYLFTDKDVLYSKIRPYLKKVALPDFTGVCSADMYPLRPKDDVILRDFLFHYMLTERFTERAIGFQMRTGIPKINREQLSAIPVPIPPLEEQRQIAAALNTCHAKILRLESEVSFLVELYEAMLEELMSGRLSAMPLIQEHQPR